MSARHWVALGERVLRSNLGQLRRPYKLIYAVTKTCHSRCRNCRIWRQSLPENLPQNPEDSVEGELSLAEVERLARNSPFLSWLNLTGGEPTDRADLVDVVATFQRHCRNLAIVNFPTNGLNPSRLEAMAGKLAELGIPMLVIAVSIDGPPQLNDSLRGIKGDFEAAVESYRVLRKIRGLKTIVGMTLYRANVARIDETVEEIRKRVPGFSHSHLHLNLGHQSSHFYANSDLNLPSHGELRTAIQEFTRRTGFPKTPTQYLELRYQKLMSHYVEKGEVPIDCAAMRSSCYLSETGVVYPCTIWDEPLGNIRDHGYSLVPLLESEQAGRLRTRIDEKDCSNCWSPCEAAQSIAANLIPLG